MKKILLAILLTSGLANAQTTHMINWFMGVSSAQASMTINSGDTVMWMWTDASMPHTVTNLAGAHETFNSGILTGVGQSFSHTFTTTGVSGYRCTLHASMQGVITVNALSNADFGREKIVAWPNPVQDVLTISGLSGETQVVVFDSSGRKISESKASTPDVKLYMDNYQSGTYYVNAISGAQKQTYQIVKL